MSSARAMPPGATAPMAAPAAGRAGAGGSGSAGETAGEAAALASRFGGAPAGPGDAMPEAVRAALAGRSIGLGRGECAGRGGGEAFLEWLAVETCATGTPSGGAGVLVAAGGADDAVGVLVGTGESLGADAVAWSTAVRPSLRARRTGAVELSTAWRVWSVTGLLVRVTS